MPSLSSFLQGVPKDPAVNVDLFDDGDTAAPRAAWRVIEAARRRYLTGMLVLGSSPTTQVYLRDGQVYWAARSTDGSIGVRLVVEGVISREQLVAGAMMVSGVEHLGRLFERVDSVDRHAVELAIELMTDEVLTEVATTEVAGYRMAMYQRHPSGIDRWLPTRVEVITHLVDGAHLADPQGPPVAAAPPHLRPTLSPPPVAVTAELPVVTAASSHAPNTAPSLVPTPAPTLVPTAPVASVPTPVAPVVPASDATADEPDLALANSIADEVAEAVRRALAAIDAATASPLDTGELRRIVDDSGSPTAG